MTDHWRVAFDASFNRSGTLAYPVAPTIEWYADDPTGSGGLTTHTFTAAGSPTDIETPFCPDGDFTAIDSGGCRTAKRFDGSTDEYSHAGAPVTWGGSFTLLAVMRPTATPSVAAAVVVRDATTSDYILLYLSSGVCRLFLDDGPNTASAGGDTITANEWMYCAGVYDSGADTLTVYSNGDAGTPASAAAITDLENLEATDIANATFAGDIAYVAGWQSALTGAQIKAAAHAWMGLGEMRGSPSTFTSTGPIAAWVDGQIEEFSDDWAIVGSEIPTGLTGAGAGHGYMSVPSVTNRVLQSRDMTSGWSEVGTSVLACGQTDTPFRDGRTTCKVTDDDASSQEFASQNISITSLSNGDSVTACLYLKGISGTFDFNFRETDGTCSGGATSYQYDAFTPDADWTVYQFDHTIQDDTCDNIRVALFGADADTAAPLGSTYVVANVFFGIDYCPPIYCETAGSQVTCGNTALAYDTSSSNITDGSGNFVGSYRTRQTLVYGHTDPSAHAGAFFASLAMHDGTISQRIQISQATGVLRWLSAPGGSHYITESYSPTVGASTVVESRINYGSDTYLLYVDGSVLGTYSSPLTSPTGVDTLDVGNLNTGTPGGQAAGGAWITDTRIYR